MANRENHYEAAFEAWLREHRVPYVAVDEARRQNLAVGAQLRDHIADAASTVTRQ